MPCRGSHDSTKKPFSIFLQCWSQTLPGNGKTTWLSYLRLSSKPFFVLISRTAYSWNNMCIILAVGTNIFFPFNTTWRYKGHSISFQTFFVQAFKITMLLLYILWDDWPIFIISGSNEQLQQELEYTLLKPDCHSWWISKMQSGREDTLEERYAIKLCFLEKMPQKRMECFRLLFNHLAWIEHEFLSGIRDSRKAGSLWGMMRGVGRVRKLEHQSWLAK